MARGQDGERSVDPIETAIRNAFEKGDPRDPAFREKVYRSAFAALDRTLKNNGGITVEKAIARRKALQARITSIETEFVAPAAAPPVAPPSAPPSGPQRSPQRDAPAMSAEPRRGTRAAKARDRVEPVMGDVGVHDDAVVLDRDLRRAERRRRRPFAVFFIVATLLALLGIGLWWAYQTGLFKTDEERDTAVRTDPIAGSEDFSPGEEDEGSDAAPLTPPSLGGESDAARNWINVFSPTDPASARTAGGASAEARSDDSGTFLTVRSNGENGAVLFDVGQGVLEQLAGRSATFDIVARASEGSENTQLSVDCDFGELGDCGRKRYAAGLNKGDLLFEVTFPQGNPGAAGTISLHSDVAGGTGAVDIYEIKVSASQ